MANSAAMRVSVEPEQRLPDEKIADDFLDVRIGRQAGPRSM
jgi:hypothetical protein